MYLSPGTRRRSSRVSESFDGGVSSACSPGCRQPSCGLIHRATERTGLAGEESRRRRREGCRIEDSEAFKPPPAFREKCGEGQRFSTEISTPLSVLMPRLARNRGGTFNGSSPKAGSASAASPFRARLSQNFRGAPADSPTAPSSTRLTDRPPTRPRGGHGTETQDTSRRLANLVDVPFHRKFQRLKERYWVFSAPPPDRDDGGTAERQLTDSLSRPAPSGVSSPSGAGLLPPRTCKSASPAQRESRKPAEPLEQCLPPLHLSIPGVRVSSFSQRLLTPPPPSPRREGRETAGSPHALFGHRPRSFGWLLHQTNSLERKQDLQENAEETFAEKLSKVVQLSPPRRAPSTDSINCPPCKDVASPIGGFRNISSRHRHAPPPPPPTFPGVPYTPCSAERRPSKTSDRDVEPTGSIEGDGDAGGPCRSASARATGQSGRRSASRSREERGGGGGRAGRRGPSANEEGLLLELLNHGDSALSPAAFVKLRQTLNRAKRSREVHHLRDWTDTSKVRRSKNMPKSTFCRPH